MLLMIDNYDSFTFNLVHYFESLGQNVVVARNDAISTAEIRQLAPDYLVLSPGPCDPDQAGVSLEVVAEFAGKIPLLGVCLGHQTIGQYFGAQVVRAPRVMHGKTSRIVHTEQGCFKQLPSPMTVTRYHSLLLDPSSLPECLEITAYVEDAPELIMGVRHLELPVEGVQFHPESVLTEHGHALLNNFLQRYA